MKIFCLSSLPLLAMAVDYPVGVTNCGVSSWIPKAPTRAVTLNQGTTEVMLALGLEDSMVGTAYLDDEIWPEYADEYAKIPVMSDRYPDPVELMSLQPDFLYASYSSAFETTRKNTINYTSVGYECSLDVERSDGTTRTYCRNELNEDSIHTYLQTPYCERPEDRAEASLQELRDEIWSIATIFNVLDNAQGLIDGIEEHFEQAAEVVKASGSEGEPITILWLDGWSDETPFVGACCGAVQTIIEAAGARNIFEDQGLDEKKSWDSVSWEEIEKRDPDLIVLVDASWDLAVDKLNHTCHHPTATKLRAVQNRAFLTIPFSASTLGVRVGSLALNMAEAMVGLARGRPLPALEFSPVSLESDLSQAVTRSGLKVFTRFPVVGDKDLHEFCPGSSYNVDIRDVPIVENENASSKDSTLSTWAIVLLCILGVGVLASVIFVGVLVSREKQGTPVFQPIAKENETT